MNEKFETVTVEIPNELYERLQELGKLENMTAEEYASKLLTDSVRDGTFQHIILQEQLIHEID